MMHIHYKDVKLENVVEEGAKSVKVRWLVTHKDGAENFAMRLFEIEPGGYTPFHKHAQEHEIFILEGEGITKTKQSEERFKKGDVLFIPSMEWHQFRNTSKKVLKFLCLIPYMDL